MLRNASCPLVGHIALDVNELWKRLENVEQIQNIKEEMLELLAELEDEEFDFEEDVAVFMWRLPEKPEFQFQLSIGKLDEDELKELGSPVRELH